MSEMEKDFIFTGMSIKQKAGTVTVSITLEKIGVPVVTDKESVWKFFIKRIGSKFFNGN